MKKAATVALAVALGAGLAATEARAQSDYRARGFPERVDAARTAESPGGQGAREPAPTRVMIRAVAKDAKVIGSNVGGARIVVREAASGEVLAEGIQEGSTGDTEAIMLAPRPRNATAYGSDPEAAGFLAELRLADPTRVEIVAEGPLGTPHAIQRATKTLLVVPGRDVLGEGVILELNGFTVELLEPEAGARPAAGRPIPLRARVTMLCGCPTEPGGLWDADRIQVTAQLLRAGRVVLEGPLSFSGETSVYEGTLTADAAGPLVLRVVAADPEKANFGMAERELEVAP